MYPSLIIGQCLNEKMMFIYEINGSKLTPFPDLRVTNTHLTINVYGRISDVVHLRT